MLSIDKTVSAWSALAARLNSGGQWLPPFFLRLILFWEFWESGITKFDGSNWFASIHDSFPFPFNMIPVDFSWFLATWSELIFAVFLLVGLFTRFSAIVLLILTAVAAAAVHWPAEWNSLSELWNGYAISDKGYGNYKLPLLYILMLFPLIFSGPGKLSIDHFLSVKFFRSNIEKIKSDFISLGIMLTVVGLPLFFLTPALGITCLLGGICSMVLKKLFNS